jgi:hypothetical protein
MYPTINKIPHRRSYMKLMPNLISALLSTAVIISAQEITETPAEIQPTPDSTQTSISTDDNVAAPAVVQNAETETTALEDTTVKTDKNVSANQPSTYSKATCTRYSRYFGFSAGFITGYGISYRRWFNNSWGLELNLFPWYNEDHYDNDLDEYEYEYEYDRDSGYSKEGNLCLGITYLKTLADLRYARILFYAGGNLQTSYNRWHYYYDTYEYRIDDYVARESSGREFNNKVSIGIGSGAEWYVWRFAFHAMLGLYGAYKVEEKGYEARPSIDIGVHFRF